MESTILAGVRKVHGPYVRKKDGRSHVVIVYNDGTKRTVSYPKFLVEFVLGRELDPVEETVDHIDDDFTNNAWSNLRIVPKSKHVAEDQKLAVKVTVKCRLCGALARKRPNHLNHNAKMGKAGPFCSHKCTGTYSREVQLGRRGPLPPQPAVPTSKRLYKKQKKTGGVLVVDLVDETITEQDILQYCSKHD